MDLTAEFGAIDIYLFDQLLKGRITEADRVFDAGCGTGRNLVYLLRAGCDVAGIDPDPRAVDATRRLATSLVPALAPDRFRVESLERHSFSDGWATVVVASAVLHFARDEAHFDAMLDGAWRVLAPGGLFFARLASVIGLEPVLGPRAAGRQVRLPDGTDRFVVDDALLAARERSLGGMRIDPLKTTVVDRQRAMTTWVARRG